MKKGYINYQRILIVKIGAIGDVIMALPMVQYLRKQYPRAEITWLCGEIVAPIVKSTGLASRVITVNEQQLFKSGKLSAITAMTKIWSRLGLEHFDLVITGHTDPRYGLMSLSARAKTKKVFTPELNKSHVLQYLNLVKNKPTIDDAEFPRIIAALPFELEKKLLPGKSIVALAPGGAKNTLRDSALKRWPLNHYVQVAQGLMEKNFQVLITGNAEDQWVVDAFPKEVTSLVGSTELTSLVKLYERCSLLITHDSGPMHLAALAHIPVFAIFGPTHPDSFFPRFRSESRVFWGGQDLVCRPCYNGREFDDCARNVCMEATTSAAVLKASTDLLLP